MVSDPTWGWPCPYCRHRIPVESESCGNCGAQLREVGNDLFSDVAGDVAQPPVLPSQVMPPPTSPAPAPLGPAEPAPPPPAEPATVGPQPAEPQPTQPESVAPELVAPEFVAPEFVAQPSVDAGAGVHAEPDATSSIAPAAGMTEVLDDPHGLAAAVARMRPEDADAAVTPIAVAGALLGARELVESVAAGQMLGHPAVIVLTDRRVLVVNGRRWQPIVDAFELGPDLVVRGRHDRHVALLTFSDHSRLSTVDGITDVALAMELTDRMRGT